VNQFGGSILDFFSNFGQLLELNLGGKIFEGQIPSLLGKLKNLVVYMNLRNNKLKGEIPIVLGNLNMLESSIHFVCYAFSM
jgi:hypothetical protein